MPDEETFPAYEIPALPSDLPDTASVAHKLLAGTFNSEEDVLPSGLRFRMRAGKGKDVYRASAMVTAKDPPLRMQGALIQIKTEFFIDGNWTKLTLDEIDDLLDIDFLALLGASGNRTKGKS